MSELNMTELRDLVEQRLETRWNEFTEEHPNLAAAIDRVHLIESSVEHLSEDPDYRAALDAATTDESMLNEAAAAIDIVDRWVARLLGI
ncbi:MAG: hypothetical protein GC162_16895 [Planctomycetes bacterium]|nr:hypothetical protein [Planctomycetota bacterium]